MKRLKRLLAALLCLGLLLTAFLPQSAQAAEAEETQAESEENDFSRPPEHGHSPYAKDFAYGQDVVFSGAYDTNRFYFQIPDYWQVEYAYARIQLTVSQLIGDGPASLTFALGDSPICSVELGGGAKERVLYVPIPVEQLKTGFNSFSVTGYVRIYDSEGCIDDLTGANWVCLDGSSYLTVGYGAENSQNRICRYPYPFLSTMDETGRAI